MCLERHVFDFYPLFAVQHEAAYLALVNFAIVKQHAMVKVKGVNVSAIDKVWLEAHFPFFYIAPWESIAHSDSWIKSTPKTSAVAIANPEGVHPIIIFRTSRRWLWLSVDGRFGCRKYPMTTFLRVRLQLINSMGEYGGCEERKINKLRKGPLALFCNIH